MPTNSERPAAQAMIFQPLQPSAKVSCKGTLPVVTFNQLSSRRPVFPTSRTTSPALAASVMTRPRNPRPSTSPGSYKSLSLPAPQKKKARRGRASPHPHHHLRGSIATARHWRAAQCVVLFGSTGSKACKGGYQASLLLNLKPCLTNKLP